MIKLRFSIGITVMIIVACSAPSFGCSGETPTVSEVCELADYIISGVVTKRETHLAGEGFSYGDSIELNLPASVVKYTVQVSQVWKGMAELTVYVFVSISSCSYEFIVGESYLIFGWHYELIPGCYVTTSPNARTPALKFAGMFYRIKPLKLAIEELDYLGLPYVDYRDMTQPE